VDILIFFGIGALAGFMAGLFGIGGGLIIVPLLYAVFTSMNYDSSIVMHMALGTSLATIMITSISSLLAHHKKNAVLWDIVKILSPGLMAGAFFGAGIADTLSTEHLQIVIGLFVIWVAYTMLKGNAAPSQPLHLPSRTHQFAAGGVIGVASALFGIGGGSLTLPYLSHYGVVMQRAVGTSAACGLPIAIAGAAGFIFFGNASEISAPNTIGYVHIYAFLGIGVMSFFTAKIGATVAHRLSPPLLKKCFAVLLVGVGLFFITTSSLRFL
jgi:uncharacterized membrane protein YfcA